MKKYAMKIFILALISLSVWIACNKASTTEPIVQPPVVKDTSYSVFVNELMASNTATIQDPDYGKWADWAELYNAGTDTAVLGGMYLSDTLGAKRTKWQIPAGVRIAPKGYWLVWLDDHDTVGTGIHGSFGLSKNGEMLGLYRIKGSDTLTLDLVVFGAQTSNVSFGRLPDGSANLTTLSTPTPGASNR